MKKSIKTTLLPLIAGTAVIGSGFSVWFFQNTSTEQTGVANKEVTQMVGVGDITAADSFSIIFDQSAESRTALGLTSSIEAKGIYLDFGDKSDKVTYASVNGTEDEIDHDGENVYFELSTEINLGIALAEYVDINYEGATKTVSNGSFKFVLGENVDTFDWTKAKFSYVTGKEPTNVTQYKSFRSVVETSDIEVTYKVEVKSK